LLGIVEEGREVDLEGAAVGRLHEFIDHREQLSKHEKGSLTRLLGRRPFLLEGCPTHHPFLPIGGRRQA